MILIKGSWTKEKYDQFVLYLNNNSDLKYKEFSSKIIKDNTMIGIRTPKLKQLSKEIFEGNYRSFLDVCDPKTYEEKLIYGLIICNLKQLNNETIKYVNNYSKMINNWALCDLFCSNIKFVNKNKEEMLKYILKNISSKNLWIRRMCFVLLLNYYVEDKYLNVIFQLCDTYNTNDYYVEMSVAWLISICYIKKRQETLEYLNNNILNDFTYNKAIQKIIDSKRISQEEKEILRKKKRR